MTVESKWETRLKTAAKKLDHTHEAPEWLQWALIDALEVAEDLSPRRNPAPAAPNFFYPH